MIKKLIIIFVVILSSVAVFFLVRDNVYLLILEKELEIYPNFDEETFDDLNKYNSARLIVSLDCDDCSEIEIRNIQEEFLNSFGEENLDGKVVKFYYIPAVSIYVGNNDAYKALLRNPLVKSISLDKPMSVN